ncbi:MAG: hypothetical protein HKK67_06840 [Chlorobiaceae bacterium]|nr:hypothetical protein [Chlorobiaceae bacterium]
MTTKNETINSIQSRIEELQNTISEKEKQIKARALHLKDDLKEELKPKEIVKKYPFQCAGMTFFTGILLTRALKGRRGATSPAQAEYSSVPFQGRGALYTIGLDVLRSAKDLGFSYLQRYIDNKLK